jgi:hypothetical protein
MAVSSSGGLHVPDWAQGVAGGAPCEVSPYPFFGESLEKVLLERAHRPAGASCRNGR